MTTINQLSRVSALSGADVIPIFQPNQGDTRGVSLTQIAAYVQTSIDDVVVDETAYNVGVGSGFSVPISDGGSVHVRIELSAPVATGTITLPGSDVRAQGQEVLVTCTKQVTALTINGSGANLSGAPTSVGPATPFKLRFDSISTTWDKVSS